jgi:hypothetical protein
MCISTMCNTQRTKYLRYSYLIKPPAGVILMSRLNELTPESWDETNISEVKLSHYMPWRHMGGEEV